MIRFDDVVIDLAAREVHRDGEEQHLEPQAFDLLVHLLDNRDRVVPKEELLDRVWGDQFVSESALTTRVKEVRRALGDDGRRQGVVRNTRGRGYRFVAEVSESHADLRGDATGRDPATRTLGVDGAGTADVGRTGHPRPPRRTLHGRSEELRAIARALEVAPLLTLVGPGGVGKTTLAMHALAAHRAGAPDGAVLVDLATADDPRTVVPSIRRATGLAAQRTTDDEALATLARRRALVVLDNCEHVVAEVAAVVDRLLAAGGPLRVLATSRERLGLRDERLLPVRPLAGPAARELFVQLGRAARPGWQPTADELDAVDELTATLDRLPLAIEMAAGRLGALGLAELARLLHGRLDALRSTARDAVDRHRTITDVVAWSEGLLEPSERQLFADLSVFAGPAALEDVVGVAGPPASAGADGLEVVETLAALVDRSLVDVDLEAVPATYRLLETTRAYAEGLPRTDGLEARHAAWFADVADGADADLRCVDEPRGVATFTRVHDELRAAHAWARAHDLDLACRLTDALALWVHSRLDGEPSSWARALLERLPADHGGRPLVLAQLASDAAHGGDAEAGWAHLEAVLGQELSLDRASELPPRTRLSLMESAADLAMYAGDLATSDRFNGAMIDLWRATGDLHAFGLGVVGLALSPVYRGRSEEGLRVLDQHERPEGMSASMSGWLAYTRAEALATSDPEASLALYRRAVELGRPVGAAFLVSVARVSLAAALAVHGDVADARASFRDLLVRVRRRGNLQHGVTMLRHLLGLLVRAGEDEVAMTLLGALTGDGIADAYGTEEELLSSARSTVAGRAGSDDLDRWVRAGRGRSVEWALELALRHVAITGTTPVPRAAR